MNQSIYFFYTSNTIKSNEGAINRAHENFLPWLILDWKYMLSK